LTILPPDNLSPTDLFPESSFIHEYLRIWQYSESPLSFDIYAILSATGAALGRKTWFDWGDTRKTFPLLSVMLTGPSGLGKTSAMNRAREPVDALPASLEKPLIVSPGTKEKLLKQLQLKANIYLFAPEMGAAFSLEDYKKSLVPTVTDLLDAAPVFYSLGGKIDGSDGIKIVNPTLSLMGASTPTWLYECMPESATTGGFWPRLMIVHEDQKRQCVPLPKRKLGPNGLEELEERKQKFFQRFASCIEAARGEIDMTEEAADLFIKWAEDYKPLSPTLGPFAERSREFVIRLSILIAVTCGETEISKEVLQGAIQLYLYTQKRLEEVVVRLSSIGQKHKEILTLLEKNSGGLTKVQIRNHMIKTLTASKTDEIIASLLACERVKEKEGKFVVVPWNDKGQL